MPEGDRPRRRRNIGASRAVLTATPELLEQRHGGYRELTVQAVAHRSGVSKSTLYRGWPDRAHRVLDTYFSRVRRDVHRPPTGDLRADLTAYLRCLARPPAQPQTRRMIAEITAGAVSDRAFRTVYRQTLLTERRGGIAEIIVSARAGGQLAGGVDAEVVADIVLGVLLHRLLLTKAPINATFVNAPTRTILTGVATGPARH